ncbi:MULTISPECIES: vanadium-dependent haloperoxidase [Roseivirga]|uniref:Phosphatidic acid phosphatase n=1 Tax=Roseivirga spongicola TaxID=333140 RepID=A0A150XH86_9BACT|nr:MULTISPECIES: vanadium-dependent haloperoxidase [Roseivirga]KYG78073.1 phosphatidic acid phosphatase [Roseivirga spongicola]MBO6661109.1 vanadium-dependent haloperoxidase [Roseivirga sp.]MBO6762074.1 vanadium-dependent haloperoxidase [Roseivirga sp.]MBO6908907.1 vanadium-dependent haloperoxidase [Roseivirga sp.]WPZ11808.1 vanadium-dependent haloperoxidase [Roseivirga spongicola]
MKKIFLTVTLAMLFAISACDSGVKELEIESDVYHETMDKLSEIIVHDIFSPPVASRIYAYPSIAMYEVLAKNDAGYQSLAGQLTELSEIPDPKEEVSYDLAALQAFIKIGTALIFSEADMDAYRDELYEELGKGVNSDFFEASVAYGDEVAAHILQWADGDMYKQTRTYPKFTVTNDPTRWQPTPPGYFEAIEPHWTQIRPFAIDSASQFTPERPTAFDMDKNSTFYKEVMEVYETAVNLTQEQKEIASFWDCNPYVMNVTGHVMAATKKITPGGHWIGIVKIACRKAETNPMQTAEAYALTSVALADGFISCWNEKFRSNLIRPETVINKYIDEEWLPLLQTPPFPEYTSGHSVISNAAAVALTSIFGDNFSFRDDTEEKYGLSVRDFDSFIDASEEAAISRLYGGIHYMPAIENGVTQGRKLGNFVVDKLELRNEALSQNEE